MSWIMNGLPVASVAIGTVIADRTADETGRPCIGFWPGFRPGPDHALCKAWGTGAAGRSGGSVKVSAGRRRDRRAATPTLQDPRRARGVARRNGVAALNGVCSSHRSAPDADRSSWSLIRIAYSTCSASRGIDRVPHIYFRYIRRSSSTAMNMATVCPPQRP